MYDDSHAPNQPIRAVFQSDGRATCYYSNGKIWYKEYMVDIVYNSDTFISIANSMYLSLK